MASPPPASSRLRMKGYNGGNMGEIVEVQGGHIVRSTGRKDRHSKVCTAKGPRDRRVRLSAHTAIQFYDVQDRLGYDRPSKAVDWLIKKAKAAIDQLDHLPAWNPIPTTSAAAAANNNNNNSDSPPKPAAESEDSLTRNTTTATTSSSAAVPPFLPPSLDSDSIADTIKSFFPIVSAEQQSSAHHHHQHQHHQHLQYHHQNHHHQSQDLRLSLQSLQDTIFHQNNDQSPLFSGATAAAAAGGWSDGGGGGFAFNPLQDGSQLLFSTQRGPLQSSNTPSVRANNWIESQSLSSMSDHHNNNQISHSIIHQNHASSSSVPAGIGFSGIGMGMGMGFSAGGGFSGGFHQFPARIRGDEEHHESGGADKPSSASSDSRH